MSDSFNTHTKILVNNNFGAEATITLTHEYSDEGRYSSTWTAVAARQSGNTAWEIGYNTGFIRTGNDYWSLQAVVSSGNNAGVWQVETFKSTLHGDDASKVLTFKVGPSGFELNKPSGNTSATIQRIS